MALQAGLDLFLDLRVLRQTAGIELIARIPSEVVMLRIFLGKKWKRGFGDGQIDPMGHGTERHGLPAVRTAGPRHRDERFAALAVAGALRYGRAPALEVHALRPGGRCK